MLYVCISGDRWHSKPRQSRQKSNQFPSLAQLQPHLPFASHPSLRHPLHLLQRPYMHCVCVLVTKPCLIPCDPMDCSPPRSSVYGIFQARILEWVAIPFSRVSSRPRDQTRVSYVSCTGSGFFTISATWEAYGAYSKVLNPFAY